MPNRIILENLPPHRRDYYMSYKKMTEILFGKALVEYLEKNYQPVSWRNIVYEKRGNKSMNQVKRDYWKIVQKIERKKNRNREKRRRRREKQNQKKLNRTENFPDLKNAIEKFATLRL